MTKAHTVWSKIKVPETANVKQFIEKTNGLMNVKKYQMNFFFKTMQKLTTTECTILGFVELKYQTEE